MAIRRAAAAQSFPAVIQRMRLRSSPTVAIRSLPSTDLDSLPTARDPWAILVSEDHAESRQTLAKVLRRMGYRVLEADNGRDALAMLQVERPLAVLMDVNMPLMDGVDATLAIRADARLADLPVFALHC